MIDAKNIMAGNWFEHNANWCFRSPENLKPFLFQWEERDWYALGECTMSLDDVSPIPLSPDILEKCGFERFHEFDMADEHWGIKTNQHNFHVMKLHGSYIAAVYFQVPVPYLHQLQNLFRSLTNQELNIHL